jgi:hypothetical protein
MKPCDRFQPRFLEHLYGALDPEESRALIDHLGGCSACQSELVRAEEQAALIASAAKEEFPWVRFDPPMKAPSSRGPADAPGGTWIRWGVAAAVLLALGGIGIPSGWLWRQQERVVRAEMEYKDAEKGLADLETRREEIVQAAQAINKDYRQKIDAVDKALADLREDTDRLAKEFREQKTKTFAALNAKKMNLVVIGPKTVQAGAFNQFQVQTKDLRLRPVPARISFRVTDQDEQVVYQKENVPSQGYLDVPMPRDLPLKGSTQLNLLVSAQGEQGQESLLKETISLTGPVYITHLVTDKPIYRPGETIRFRSLTLERFSLRPAADELHLLFSLIKPTGEKIEILRGSSQLMKDQDKTPILGPDHKPIQGVGAGEYRIDAQAPGGEYTLMVSELNDRFPPQERKFFVDRYQKPEVSKAKSGSKDNDADGKKLLVEFFPEGGDLVADATNRVYFTVHTARGRPAELTGQIVDETDRAVAEVTSWNDADHPKTNPGMGVLTFKPQAGKRYQLKITGPAGIEGSYFLPEVKNEGVVLGIAKGVVGDKEPIQLLIQNAGRDRSLLIGAYCRGRLMAHETVDMKNGETREIQLGLESGVGGVFRLTVFEVEAGQGRRERLVPRAERLIYRVPAERLTLSVKPEKTGYAPGENVKVQLDSRNEKNQPLPAMVMVAAVDQRVFQRANGARLPGGRAWSTPAHFLLTTEVRLPEDLEDADFLLSPEPGAAAALDLLLGTQGWRRFAEQDPAKFRKEQKDQAERFLVLNGLSPTRSVDYSQEEVQNVVKEFQIKASKLEERLVETTQAQALIGKGEQQKKELARLKLEAETAQTERLAAVIQWEEAKANLAATANKLNNFKELMANRALPALMAVFLIAGIAALAVGLVRNKTPQAVRYFATAACSMLVFGFLAMTELALNGHNTLAESGLAADNRGSGSPRELSEKDLTALFSLDDGLAKKDKTGDKPGRHLVLPIGRKPIGPARQPRDRAVLQPGFQMEKEKTGPDTVHSPEATVSQDKSPAQQSRSFAGIPLPPPPPPPLIIRQYAHVHARGQGQDRGDFAETLFWQPVLVLPDGRGEVSFELCDSETTFQVRAAGHTLDGRLAEITFELTSRKP